MRRLKKIHYTRPSQARQDVPLSELRSPFGEIFTIPGREELVLAGPGLSE